MVGVLSSYLHPKHEIPDRPRRIRRTELALMPICLAMASAVQWVVSPGGGLSVSAAPRRAMLRSIAARHP